MAEGGHNILIRRHLLGDEEKFRRFFRLNILQFDYILDLVKEEIFIVPCNRVIQPITAAEKLSITLRGIHAFIGLPFLSSLPLHQCYHTPKTSSFGEKTYSNFSTDIISKGLEKQSFRVLSEMEFSKLHRCYGKHIILTCLSNSGTLYYNYKGFFSIVLLAIADANYKFIYVDIGSYGKEGDSEILKSSKIGRDLVNGNIFPPPCKLPNTEKVLSHVVVGDEALRLQTHLLKPFRRAIQDEQKAIFNYRLSRARRVSENAFCLLSQVFRIFYKPINMLPETVDKAILVSCYQHNMLRDAFLEQNLVPHFQPQNNDKTTQNLLPTNPRGGFGNMDGFRVRNDFKDYFNTPQGKLQWQEVTVSSCD